MIYYADWRVFPDALLQKVLPLLPEEKRTAIAKIVHLPTRRQSITAWALLLYALRTKSRKLPPLAFTEMGKPYFAGSDLHFNLSHTDTLVCAAVAETPVGVDVQTLTAPSDGVIRRVLSEREQHLLRRSDDSAALFTRFWTQKEAYAKWTGEGLSCAFSSLDFSPYALAVAFSAFGAAFRVWRFPETLMAVCSERPVEETQKVTPQMLETLLFQNDG